MLCYEVLVNGNRRCIAGVPEGVLVGALTWTGDQSTEAPQSRVSLRVGGISGGNHVDWVLEPLALGDDVVFRLTDCETADPPTDLRPIDSVEARKKNLEMSRALYASLRRSLADLETEWGTAALAEAEPTERRD